MPRLPDAHSRAVRLHLIDIPPFNPHRLTLHNRLLNDRRLLNHDRLGDHCGLLNHDRLGHDRRRGLNHDRVRIIRTRQGRPYHAADHTADESRPEVTTATPPITAVVMMVAAMPTMVITAMPTVVMMPSMRESASRGNNKCDRYYEFFPWYSPL